MRAAIDQILSSLEYGTGKQEPFVKRLLGKYGLRTRQKDSLIREIEQKMNSEKISFEEFSLISSIS